MRPSENIQNWRLLHALNKKGTLSSAAEVLGIELSEASRRISSLEKECQTIFLDRNSRPAKTTLEAKRLDVQAGRIARAYNAALLQLEAIQKEQVGRKQIRNIRISLPANFDKVPLLCALYEYEQKHTDLHLEFSADSGIEALLEHLTDISMAGYLWRGKGVYALPIAQCFNFIMASTHYLRRWGEPRTIDELLSGKHRILMRNRNNRFFSDKLTNGEHTAYVPSSADIFYGDAAACREMLLSGSGIATDLSIGYVSEYIAQGLVKPILVGWHREPWTFYVYCRAEDSENNLIRTIMAHIAQKAFSQISNQWGFWYERLGLPRPPELSRPADKNVRITK